MGKDYYNILGVEKNSSQEDIKRAFRKKAHEYHPDKATGNEAKFKEINEAYQVLGNEKKRSQYDQFGSTFNSGGGQPGGFGGYDFSQGFGGGGQGFNVNFDDLGDIFEGFGDIFGSSSTRKKTRGSRGRDLHYVLEIDFLEAAKGTEKELNLEKLVKCEKCHGNGAEPGTKIETCQTCQGNGHVVKIQRTFLGNIQTQALCHDCGGEGKIYSQKCSRCGGEGRIKDEVSLKIRIPAGIDNGQTIRLAGQGEVGQKGASAGDLFVEMKVKPSIDFERDGDNVKSQAEISFIQASLGDKIDIKTIDGPLKLRIPEGTQPGTIFKLRDRGIYKLQGRGRGDHLVEIKVLVPKKLTRKQKELIKELDL